MGAESIAFVYASVCLQLTGGRASSGGDIVADAPPDLAPLQAGVPDPNLPAKGKRPRSSMSPTIVLRRGRPFEAVGAAGGATIITTVLGILLNRIDFGMKLPEAIAAPRAAPLPPTRTPGSATRPGGGHQGGRGELQPHARGAFRNR